MKNIIDKLKRQSIISLLEIKNSDCAKIDYIEKYNYEYESRYTNFTSYKELDSIFINYDILYNDIKKNICKLCNNKEISLDKNNICVIIKEILKEIYIINNNDFCNKSNFILCNHKIFDSIEIYLNDITIIVDNTLEDQIIIGKKTIIPEPGLVLLYNTVQNIYKIAEIGRNVNKNFCVIKYNLN